MPTNFMPSAHRQAIQILASGDPEWLTVRINVVVLSRGDQLVALLCVQPAEPRKFHPLVGIVQ